MLLSLNCEISLNYESFIDPQLLFDNKRVKVKMRQKKKKQS